MASTPVMCKLVMKISFCIRSHCSIKKLNRIKDSTGFSVFKILFRLLFPYHVLNWDVAAWLERELQKHFQVNWTDCRNKSSVIEHDQLFMGTRIQSPLHCCQQSDILLKKKGRYFFLHYNILHLSNLPTMSHNLFKGLWEHTKPTLPSWVPGYCFRFQNQV